ncbi:MAG: hypothetical protein Ct9H300mP1_31840 [Planctomycetaceae bacterium]|nr:MAG: hypothetical protein Ct9H300mP1_31840 [Planctomycetaceae bacterium]
MAAAAEIQQAESGVGGQVAVGDVVAQGTVLGQALILAVLRDQGQPRLNHGLRKRSPDDAAHANRARDDRVESEQAAEHLGPPGTDQARDSQDLTPVQHEIDVTWCRSSGQPLEVQHRITGRVRDGGEQFLDLAANHHRDDFGLGRALQHSRAGNLAIAETRCSRHTTRGLLPGSG